MARGKIETVSDRRGKSAKHHQPDWTIMIYLAGDNNLSPNSIAIMQELEAAAHRADVRVLACFDSNSPLPKGARYLEINYGRYHPHQPTEPKMDWGLHNDMVYPGHIVVSPDFCNPNPSSIKLPYEPTAKVGLARFLKWALDKHRGKRNILIVFGHGTAVAGNTFLADDNPPSFVRLTEFSQILKCHFGGKHHRLDILACDNCVMNGLETAYEIRGQVDYILGSQDLMLTVGWPYKNIINTVIRNYRKDDPLKIAKKVLKVCARNLLDFTLMERSSEQSICDVGHLRGQSGAMGAIRKLVDALEGGLEFQTVKKEKQLKFPIARDAIRLARLEAQSYWDETFVDLYDFCELLLLKCNELMPQEVDLSQAVLKMFLDQLVKSAGKTGAADQMMIPAPTIVRDWLVKTPLGIQLQKIADACKDVLDLFRGKVKIVPWSYYVCPALQYSHGLSVYFPWTLPEKPIIFEPGERSAHAPYEPRDYCFVSPFEEYQKYDFAGPTGANWACLLRAFWRATLRDVRRVDYTYDKTRGLDFHSPDPINEKHNAPPADLQKSTSSTGEDEESVRIKNYPRRFYLSPNDCDRRMKIADLPGDSSTARNPIASRPGQVSYLGWNIRGLVAEVIKLPPQPKSAKQLDDAGGEENENRAGS
jgi:hypothetical protein